jgi:2-iminobutanoate/2-iminopropanoate deaminase
MIKNPIHTEQAPAAIGPYSQAVRAGGFVFVSGQLGIDPSTGQLAAPEPSRQADQALRNIHNILDAAGLGMKAVVKVTVYLTNLDDFAAVNTVYAKHFDEPFPARACVEVSRLPKGAAVEIEAVATQAPA